MRSPTKNVCISYGRMFVEELRNIHIPWYMFFFHLHFFYSPAQLEKKNLTLSDLFWASRGRRCLSSLSPLGACLHFYRS